jgi:hypothetical protein
MSTGHTVLVLQQAAPGFVAAPGRPGIPDFGGAGALTTIPRLGWSL